MKKRACEAAYQGLHSQAVAVYEKFVSAFKNQRSKASCFLAACYIWLAAYEKKLF